MKSELLKTRTTMVKSMNKSSRRGITLIEVLSAIAVASIGVFGVLVLVPLASRMSQIGFSNEAARSNSTNVLAKAKSFGALDYSRWTVFDPATATDTAPFFANAGGLVNFTNATDRPTGAFCIDPLLLSQNAAVNLFPATFANQGLSTSATGNTIAIPRASVAQQRTATPIRMGSAIAQEFLSEANTMRLLPAVSDVAYPTQKYVDDPGAGRIKREVTSAKSSLLLMLPSSRPDSLIYRAMALTIDGRQLIGGDFDRVFNVTDQLSGSTTIRTEYGMLDLTLTEVDHDTTATEKGDNLPSGGWVLLVPFNPATLTPIWEGAKAYEVYSSDPTNPPATDDGHTLNVTLVGPPYVAPDTVGGPALTQAIYVPGTVDIHEMEVRLGVE